jgi:hypothetical protein
MQIQEYSKPKRKGISVSLKHDNQSDEMNNYNRQATPPPKFYQINQ